MKIRYGRGALVGFMIPLLAALLSSTGIRAEEPPETLWIRLYGGNLPDRGNAVQQTPDGGYIIVGTTLTHVSVPNDANVYLIKTDADGELLWERPYGGDGVDYGNSIDQTTDGGYIIVGESRSFGAIDYDMYIIKTDAQGDTLWTRIYGGTGYDKAFWVQETSAGDYVVAGFGTSFGAGQDDAYLMKVDPSGNKLWLRTYGGPNRDVSWEVQETTDGGYILCGFYEPQYNVDDCWLIKTDVDGNLLWENTYGGAANDVAFSVQQTSDGGYIMAGYTFSYGAGRDDLYLVKTDSLGNQLWDQVYGGPHYDMAYRVRQTPDDGYIVTGWTRSFGAGSQDAWLLRTNASGEELWSETYGGESFEDGIDLQLTDDGGYIVVGTTASYGGGQMVYVIKTGPDLVSAVVSDPLPFHARLFQNHPNPFNPSTMIDFSLDNPASTRLIVYDVQGREVRLLVDGIRPAGSHVVLWDGRDHAGRAVPSGTYMYRLQSDGTTQMRKMLLMK